MEYNTLDSSLIDQDRPFTEADLASGLRRFANSLIDVFVIYILYFVLFLIFFRSNIDYTTMKYSFYPVWIIYYTFMEFAIGKTIGKMVTGTKVVTLNGEKPGFGTAFARTLCRFIPFEGFSFLGSPCKGWHDTIAKSRVIMDR